MLLSLGLWNAGQKAYFLTAGSLSPFYLVSRSNSSLPGRFTSGKHIPLPFVTLLKQQESACGSMHEPCQKRERIHLKLADVLGISQMIALLPRFVRPHLKAAPLHELKPVCSACVTELVLPAHQPDSEPRLSRVRRAACHCLKPKVHTRSYLLFTTLLLTT